MNSLSTVLRAAGILAVLLLAGLGMLFVLDLIPREMLKELATKSVVMVGILAAAGLTIALLLKKK